MAVWRERESLADMWLDARPGALPVFALLAQGQQALVSLRAVLKQLYATGMRSWQKLTS
jgi:hypothetical protein